MSSFSAAIGLDAPVEVRESEEALSLCAVTGHAYVCALLLQTLHSRHLRRYVALFAGD
jgi:hypothetical protein